MHLLLILLSVILINVVFHNLHSIPRPCELLHHIKVLGLQEIDGQAGAC